MSREPVRRATPDLAAAQAFIREAIEAGYHSVYLTPAMYREVQAASLPGPGDVWASVAIYSEPYLADGWAVALVTL